ncbi:MAG: MarR family transcriptional regulator [Bacteroidales bacterium]|nr:MarR family transcriptional regulator [Bacteroidales bacterium]
MKNSYHIIKQIIGLLESYEETGSRQKDLFSFLEWAISRIREEPELNKPLFGKRRAAEYTEQFSYIRSLEEKSRFMECVSRIARFHEFYIRKFLENLPLNSRLEYLFLYTVHHMDRARKTDLINIHIVEYTTGMDTIKRLINYGVLQETPDEHDKRAKLLTLTEKGRRVMDQSKSKMSDEINMFLACISSNKWRKVLPVLEELNEFHNMVYINHNDKSPAELSNLMDSLKHLYQ